MAEEDAEISLLHQMQADQDGVAWDDGTGDAGEGEEPSNTEHSDQQVQEDDYVPDEPDLRVQSTSGVDVVPDGGVHDPLSVPTLSAAVSATSQQDSRSSSRASEQKPKTIGGFIADDSDDEDYVPPPTSTSTGLQPQATDVGARSLSRSPLHTSITAQNVQIQAHSQVASNGTPSLDTPPHVHNVGDHSDPSTQPTQQSVPSGSSNLAAAASNVPKARLPHDRVGILEDRIKEDPRGDIDAWLSLIGEHRKRNKLEDARAAYDRFFKVFPSAADVWVAYAEMELSNDNFYGAEQIFNQSLLTVPNVQLWSVYLDYIRRRNDLTNDVSGTARATITQAYEFVLSNIGIDRDSGKIWQEYVQFIRNAPGQIGGSGWQDQQKMDLMRKAYQRAICIPMSNINALWKEYDQFEMGLNKITGRKFLQELSPAYVTARSANINLENITRGLVRTNMPQLPPAPGFEGDQEYVKQVELWHKWIHWELEDPLVLKDEDLAGYQKRVVYVYKQAVMALRFWPEIWVEAADWCYSNDLITEGDDFLTHGIAANPESCLITFKQADRFETTLPAEEGDEGLANRGSAIREPYNKLLDTLYDLLKKLKARETVELARIEENAALDASVTAVLESIEEEDEDSEQVDKVAKESAKTNHIKAVQQGYAVQTQLLSRTISFVWIALMRAMRRVQGKGKVGALVGGSRQILNDARARGRITSDVYVASALIEHNVYKDPAGTKIFERGAKLFPEDEGFILEYLKHLLSIADITNARAVFETSVNRLTQKPELLLKAKPLYAFFHKYESEYGELSQISKLENRMADLFPDDPKLQRFTARFSTEGFDPTAVRPIISPATQLRPKNIVQSIERPTPLPISPRPQSRQGISPRPQRRDPSPRPTYPPSTNSPKRPLGGEESDNENRPRKLARGESPLKGAAGRRLDQQKRLQQNYGTPTQQGVGAAPFVIPRDITFLLSIIPRAETYNASRFNPEAMVQLLSKTNIPDYASWKAYRELAARYDGVQYVR